MQQVRCYACITNILVNENNSLPKEIPTHKYLEKYLPDTQFHIQPHIALKNCNVVEEIEALIKYIKNNILLINSNKLQKIEEESSTENSE